jgi:hypothetical protein
MVSVRTSILWRPRPLPRHRRAARYTLNCDEPPNGYALRLFTIAAALTRHSRQTVLTLNQKQPWSALAHRAVTALRALPAPG